MYNKIVKYIRDRWPRIKAFFKYQNNNTNCDVYKIVY